MAVIIRSNHDINNPQAVRESRLQQLGDLYQLKAALAEQVDDFWVGRCAHEAAIIGNVEEVKGVSDCRG